MSQIVTLANLRSQIRGLSDFEGSEFIGSDNVLLDTFINGSMKLLYDEMCNAFQQYFISTYIYQTNVISQNQSVFEFPLRFQKLEWLKSDANTTRPKAIDKIQSQEGMSYLYGNSNIPSTYIMCAYVPCFRNLTTTAKTFVAANVFVSPTNVINVADHDLVTGEKLYFTNSGGALPGGIYAGIAYYAIVLDKDNFSIANNPHDALFYRYIQDSTKRVQITTTGTGTQTIADTYDRFDAINGYEMFAVWDAVTKILQKAERDPTLAVNERNKEKARLDAALKIRDQGRPMKMWDVNTTDTDFTGARDTVNYLKYYEWGRNFVIVNATWQGW